MWDFNSLKDILDVVMVPIALALLAPWITRRWQDRQRDSQTKTELVAEISGLVMTTVMTIHLFKTNLKPHSNTDHSQEKEEEDLFEEKAKVIEEILVSKITGFRGRKKANGKI